MQPLTWNSEILHFETVDKFTAMAADTIYLTLHCLVVMEPLA